MLLIVKYEGELRGLTLLLDLMQETVIRFKLHDAGWLVRTTNCVGEIKIVYKTKCHFLFRI
jgi:hypothetical protein